MLSWRKACRGAFSPTLGMIGQSAVLGSMIHIQSSLDSDLSLGSLSRIAGRSPCHFQRVFAAMVGETPKQYVTRLRLERAAFHIRVQDTSLLQIALDCGFQNHETFTRAFRRRFGLTPSRYRENAAATGTQIGERPKFVSDAAYELSNITVRNLRPCHLAFVRHLGPYAQVPQDLFNRLKSWADRRELPQPHIWLGLGHDAPSTTSPEQLRFDAALMVTNPFRSGDQVGYQAFPGGLHAIATHVGAYSTLEDAYTVLLPQLLSLAGYRLIGLPVVEIYQTNEIRTVDPLNTTELCFPIERV
ncbi:MAG: hypothetical protein C0472_07815 [Erythrobacter sp.]|nr:hypothetical protein [Erythrobacter sp.]MBA4051770.1 hypothetical protein [Erythrobacter sp.]